MHVSPSISTPHVSRRAENPKVFACLRTAQPWQVVAATCAIGMLLCNFHRSTFTMLLPELSQHYGLSMKEVRQGDGACAHSFLVSNYWGAVLLHCRSACSSRPCCGATLWASCLQAPWRTGWGGRGEGAAPSELGHDKLILNYHNFNQQVS